MALKRSDAINSITANLQRLAAELGVDVGDLRTIRHPKGAGDVKQANQLHALADLLDKITVGVCGEAVEAEPEEVTAAEATEPEPEPEPAPAPEPTDEAPAQAATRRKNK